MTNSLKLYFNHKPTPHQSVRAAKGFYYVPARIKAFKKFIAMSCKKQLPLGFKMFPRDTALKMQIYHYFEYRKGEKKDLVAAGEPIPKITKPDVMDNLNKALVDAMAEIVFEQDQQIFHFKAAKYWWKRDAISVRIQSL